MYADPYHDVQQEIETSLQNAGQLLSSYRRIRSMARDDSEELTYAQNEVRHSQFLFSPEMNASSLSA